MLLDMDELNIGIGQLKMLQAIGIGKLNMLKAIGFGILNVLNSIDFGKLICYKLLVLVN